MVATAAAVLAAAVAVHAMPAERPAANYWWKYPNKDCGWDDVPGSCESLQAPHMDSVSECSSDTHSKVW